MNSNPLAFAEWLRQTGYKLHSIESCLYDLAAKLERPSEMASWQRDVEREVDRLATLCEKFQQWVDSE